jgi:hypothetical protein
LISKWSVFASTLLIGAVMAGSAAHAGGQYNVTFTDSNGDTGNVTFSVNGSNHITSASGTFTPDLGAALTVTAVSAYAGADNVFNSLGTAGASPAWFDYGGFSFTTSSGLSVNLAEDNPPSTPYSVDRSDLDPSGSPEFAATFNVQAAPSAVPEPASLLTLLAGGIGLAALRRRRVGQAG